MFSNRPSKSGKRGFGKRRTVVQLDDEPRRQPTYGFGYKPTDEVQKHEVTGNALSGIMSQYAMDSPSDDNSGDDEDESPNNGPPAQETQRGSNKWPKFVAATDTQLPTLKATETSVASEKSTEAKQQEPVSSGTGGSGDDIDIKLKDFLAEIESIDVPEKSPGEEVEVKGEEKQTEELTPHEPKPAEPTPDSDADNAIGTSEDDTSPPVEPKEPLSVWQHCLDEGTQCYYYWNTETNAVTWEIPAEFSQYLLRYKEYERLLAKYEKEMAEWKRQHGGRKTKKLAKKERKHKKKVDDEKEVIEPLVSYPPIPEEEEEQATEEDAPLIYGPQKPPDDVLEKLADNDSIAHDAELGSFEPQSSHSDAKEKTTKDLKATNDVEKLTTDGSMITKKRHRSKSSKHQAEAEDVEVEKHHDAKLHDSEVRSSERKATSQDHDSKSVSRSSPVTDGYVSSSTGMISCASDDGKTSETSFKLLPDAHDEQSTSVGERKMEELEDEEEFVNRELEEPIFTHYEYVNKKYKEGQSDDVDLAVEDIDRELELALERRTNKTEAGFISKKRKQEFLEEDPNSERKRLKTETTPANVPVSSAWKTSIKDEIKTKVDELAQVLDLASTVLEKLEFLEVSQSCLSKLQVLLVQTQTRLEDWKAGGLSAAYMLQRLQESAATLHQYEQNASPPGWSCLWDRTFKRYFYSHNVTGETSWAYPEVVAEGPEKLQSHDNEGTTSPYCDATINEPEQLCRSGASQAATDGTMMVRMRKTSEVDSENALPIPSDLLSWAANPPPPPPATPPPPPSPSQTSEPFSSTEMDCDDQGDQAVNPLMENTSGATNEDLDICATEPVFPATEPQMPPGQISAPPMITKSAPSQPMTTHKDGVGDVVVSPDGSVVASVLPSGATHEGLYDGVPMEDPTGSHPVKEKKKKKEKPLLGGGLAMKKKNVSSMVEKWQKIQVDFSKEDEKERSRQMKLAELAGKAASSSSKTD